MKGIRFIYLGVDRLKVFRLKVFRLKVFRLKGIRYIYSSYSHINTFSLQSIALYRCLLCLIVLVCFRERRVYKT